MQSQFTIKLDIKSIKQILNLWKKMRIAAHFHPLLLCTVSIRSRVHRDEYTLAQSGAQQTPRNSTGL